MKLYVNNNNNNNNNATDEDGDDNNNDDHNEDRDNARRSVTLTVTCPNTDNNGLRIVHY